MNVELLIFNNEDNIAKLPRGWEIIWINVCSGHLCVLDGRNWISDGQGVLLFWPTQNGVLCYYRKFTLDPGNEETRADKGWAVKRACPSKKVWCSGLGLCLEMSLVFDFLRCGLSIRHCRCHWIMAAWYVFLHFFLVPLCWYAVSERQMLLFLRKV